MSDQPLQCTAHGRQEWKGHLVCSRNAGGCGEVFQTQDAAAPRFAAVDCSACAKRLMPVTKGEDPRAGKGFTARSFCPLCFDVCVEAAEARALERAALEAHDTEPPGEPPQ